MNYDHAVKRLKKVVDSKAQIEGLPNLTCGGGWDIGTCPCIECHEHREDLAALDYPVPEIVNGLDESGD